MDHLDDLPRTACPECSSEEYTHLGTLGFTEHYRCRLCGWDWPERDLGAIQASYEHACDQIRAQRKEEG